VLSCVCPDREIRITVPDVPGCYDTELCGIVNFRAVRYMWYLQTRLAIVVRGDHACSSKFPCSGNQTRTLSPNDR
jgi:hypothetical protein